MSLERTSLACPRSTYSLITASNSWNQPLEFSEHSRLINLWTAWVTYRFSIESFRDRCNKNLSPSGWEWLVLKWFNTPCSSGERAASLSSVSLNATDVCTWCVVTCSAEELGSAWPLSTYLKSVANATGDPAGPVRRPWCKTRHGHLSGYWSFRAWGLLVFSSVSTLNQRCTGRSQVSLRMMTVVISIIIFCRFDSRNSEIGDVLSWATLRHSPYPGNSHALSSVRKAKADVPN